MTDKQWYVMCKFMYLVLNYLYGGGKYRSKSLEMEEELKKVFKEKEKGWI